MQVSPGRRRFQLAVPLTAAFALSILGAASLGRQDAGAFCTEGITRWYGNSITTGIRTSIPADWNSTMTNVLADWNNVSGSALHYYGPVFNDGSPHRSHTISRVNFTIAGWPDNIPGATTNASFLSGKHQVSYVSLNSTWTWNRVGTMNQSQKKADVHTVTLHEVGHSSGLHHPSVCGSMTAAEVAAVMNPQYVKKWDLNSDDKAGLDSRY